MKNMKHLLWTKITPVAKLYLKYFLLVFAFAFAFRVIFNLWNFVTLTELPFNVISKAFYLGLKFDLRISQIFALPLFLLIFIPKINLFTFKIFRIFLALILNILFMLYLLTYFNDFGFYAYLGDRLNASVLKFFETPEISLNMVWESYPVVWIILGLFGIVYLHHVFLKKNIKKLLEDKRKYFFKEKITSILVCFLIFAATAYGKFSWFPLRWSEAYFSPEPMASKLAINPIHHFFDTLKYHDKKEYDVQAVKNYYDNIANYLGVKNKNPEEINLIREYLAKDSKFKDYNIVMVMMESLSYNKTSISNNPLDPSPHLKSIASDAILFTQHYTPTVATARGVFASIISHPDMTPGKGSSSRNPFIVNQHSIINQFEHYSKFYFLGGSANWGNIRGLFTNNIHNIKIFEEGSYSAPRTDVWGISDIDLFIEADKVLKNTKEKFFAFIQTASFHRPFTIPKVSYGFENKVVDKELLEKYGFDSLEEYNSMRFMDHALAHFMKLAKLSGYFDKTLFIIYGDHGITTNRSDHMEEGYVKHGLTSYHVPLIFYAPKIIKPEVISTVASQVDILPTIAGFFGIPYKTQTIGRDLFDKENDGKNYAFVFSWFATPPKFGLIDDEFYYSEQADQIGLYKYKTKDYFKNYSKELPQDFKKMQDLARGLYETSRHRMYYNVFKEEKK
jgi:phosphoglycerol transferase MdoB-like AlkP superfamily enzyme